MPNIQWAGRTITTVEAPYVPPASTTYGSNWWTMTVGIYGPGRAYRPEGGIRLPPQPSAPLQAKTVSPIIPSAKPVASSPLIVSPAPKLVIAKDFLTFGTAKSPIDISALSTLFNVPQQRKNGNSFLW